jgi:ATP-dependent 26S proteasome regulatory subunit
MSEMEEVLEKTKKEFTAVEAEENELRSKEVDIKHDVEKFEAVYKENQLKVKYWQKEVNLVRSSTSCFQMSAIVLRASDVEFMFVRLYNLFFPSLLSKNTASYVTVLKCDCRLYFLSTRILDVPPDKIY